MLWKAAALTPGLGGGMARMHCTARVKKRLCRWWRARWPAGGAACRDTRQSARSDGVPAFLRYRHHGTRDEETRPWVTRLHVTIVCHTRTRGADRILQSPTAYCTHYAWRLVPGECDIHADSRLSAVRSSPALPRLRLSLRRRTQIPRTRLITHGSRSACRSG